MPKAYKVTDELLAKYYELIEKGLSKADACRRIGIAPTTMHDHLKRIEPLKTYIYSIMKRAGSLLIVLDNGSYYKVDSNALLGNDKTFIASILNRDTYVMNQSELNHFGLYKKGYMSDIDNGASK